MPLKILLLLVGCSIAYADSDEGIQERIQPVGKVLVRDQVAVVDTNSLNNKTVTGGRLNVSGF